MSNSYTQFCCKLDNLTEAEEQWLDSTVYAAYSWANDDEREDTLPPNAMAMAMKDCDSYGAGLSITIDRGERIFSDDGGEGEIEPLAELVSEFLRKFRPNAVWGFTWAGTYSRQLPDEFGGGAVLVKANEIEYMDTWSWLRERRYGATD